MAATFHPGHPGRFSGRVYFGTMEVGGTVSSGRSSGTGGTGYMGAAFMLFSATRSISAMTPRKISRMGHEGLPVDDMKALQECEQADYEDHSSPATGSQQVPACSGRAVSSEGSCKRLPAKEHENGQTNQEQSAGRLTFQEAKGVAWIQVGQRSPGRSARALQLAGCCGEREAWEAYQQAESGEPAGMPYAP